uniref:Uncharacterized protein n=1 Tax=Glossina pallidipes TaxID=7398 RepID=A0A1A9ZAP9_GLOPL
MSQRLPELTTSLYAIYRTTSSPEPFIIIAFVAVVAFPILITTMHIFSGFSSVSSILILRQERYQEQFAAIRDHHKKLMLQINARIDGEVQASSTNLFSYHEMLPAFRMPEDLPFHWLSLSAANSSSKLASFL